ncbi:hypothetical protein GGS20DRAFT_591660 [Poronia punctata]|nr:hypothetical protein GGS20DRAFT_591660 [Poronia punctata]
MGFLSPDENPSWRDIIVNTVFNALGIIVVGLRLYSRRLTRAAFGWDDGLIIVSTVFVNGMLVVTVLQISLGFGLPMREIKPDSIEALRELNRACRFLFLLSICFVKLSALAFYLRVFGTRTAQGNIICPSNCNRGAHAGASKPDLSSRLRHYRHLLLKPSQRLLYIYLMVIVVSWSIANVLQELTVCDKDKPMCTNQRDTDLGICVFNAVGDLVVLGLPLWPIWRLKMKTGTKAGLTVVFLLGIATTIVAFLRFGAIVSTDYGGDYLESAMKASNLAILEANLAILCMNLPMLQPLFRRAYRRLQKRYGHRFEWLGKPPQRWTGRSPGNSVLSGTSRRRFQSISTESSKKVPSNDCISGANIGKSVTFDVVSTLNVFPTTPTACYQAYPGKEVQEDIPRSSRDALTSQQRETKAGMPQSRIRSLWASRSRTDFSQNDTEELAGMRKAASPVDQLHDDSNPSKILMGITTTCIGAAT